MSSLASLTPCQHTTLSTPRLETHDMPSLHPRLHKKPITHRFFNAHIFTCLWLACGLPLANAANQEVPLGWQEAMTRTLEKNPALVAQGFEFKAQAGRILQAESKTNPEMAVMIEDALGTGNYSAVDSAEATFSINWVLDSQQRSERIATANAQSGVLETLRDIQRLDVAADTARLFVQLLTLQKRLEQVERAIVLATDIRNTLKQRVQAGKTPAAELARANVDVSQRQLDKEDLEHELAVTQRQLAAQWGASKQDFSHVAGDIFQLPSMAEYAIWHRQLEQNPRLDYFVNQKRWHESQLALAKAESKGLWTLTTGIKHLEASNDQAAVVGFSIPLNIYPRQRGRMAETQALMEMEQAHQGAEKLRIETSLYGLYQEIEHYRHIVEVYHQQIMPELESALADTRRGYDIGRYSFLEWQLLQQQYLEAGHTLLDAALGAHLKSIEIERLTGVHLSPLATSAKPSNNQNSNNPHFDNPTENQ